MSSMKYKIITTNHKGRCLSATLNIATDEIVLEESPLVSAQFSYNKAYGYLACEHCMFPLETAEQNVRRLAFNPSIILPFKEVDPSIVVVDKIVQCADTKVKFCSEACKIEAEKKYHKLVGPHLMPGQALDYVNEIWKKFHYPPETATILLVLRIFAIVKNFPEMMSQFSEFSDRPINEDEKFCHKMLGEKFTEQLAELQKSLLNVFAGDEVLEKFLTNEGLIRLFALIGTNAQGIGTSSFALWVKNVGEMNLNDSQRKEVDELIDTLYTTFDDTVGTQFLNNEGSGLYLTQSKINHSCNPNAEIKFPYNNHVIQVVALRPIAENEEICISYLDECQLDRSRHSRQKHLMENYLFLCDCEKCKSEADQPDVTSDEEEEDDDDEMDED